MFGWLKRIFQEADDSAYLRTLRVKATNAEAELARLERAKKEAEHQQDVVWLQRIEAREKLVRDTLRDTEANIKDQQFGINTQVDTGW